MKSLSSLPQQVELNLSQPKSIKSSNKQANQAIQMRDIFLFNYNLYTRRHLMISDSWTNKLEYATKDFLQSMNLPFTPFFSKKQKQTKYLEVYFDGMPEQLLLSPMVTYDIFETECSVDEDEVILLKEQCIEQKTKTSTKNKKANNDPIRKLQEQFQRRIDKQIRFDIFHYTLLQFAGGKQSQPEKKRQQVLNQKNHRSILSLFVLIKFILLQKRLRFDVNALKKRVTERALQKYQKAKTYPELLKSEINFFIQAIDLFANKKQMEAIEKVYNRREIGKSSIPKMIQCKEKIQSI